MMPTVATRFMGWSALHWRPDRLRRARIAGTAWGVPVAAIIIARGAVECGGLCLTDAAVTTALSIAAGIITIGPIAAFDCHHTVAFGLTSSVPTSSREKKGDVT